jgi:hypothetical protein
METGALPIPIEIQSLAARAGKGSFIRSDVGAAEAALKKLGIDPRSEYYSFALCYCLGNFFPHALDDWLCEICEPTEEVLAGTSFVHDVWQLPDDFICLTSCQGEGCFLLSRTTGEIFDFSLADREAFLQGAVARWPSFFEFMRAYLTPEAA